MTNDLVTALRKLDRRLEAAVALAATAYGPEAACDPLRGLHVTQSDVQRLLAREPAQPLLHVDWSGPTDDFCMASLSWLARTFGLSQFELDIVLIGLAPELDLRYERIYAFLQDDVSRRRPSIDLALNLLCDDLDAKLRHRADFAPDAPLVRHGLVQIFSDSNPLQASLLAHCFKVDDQLTRLLLGQTGLDPRLAGTCDIREPRAAPAELSDAEARAASAYAAGRPLRLVFAGPAVSGKREATERLADALHCRLVSADVADVQDLNILKLMIREAWFLDAVLYVEGFENLPAALQHAFLNLLAESNAIVIIAVDGPWQTRWSARSPLGFLTVAFDMPTFQQRRSTWQSQLDESGIHLTATDVDFLAGRFRLSRPAIAEAVAAAAQHDTPNLEVLVGVARAQSSERLLSLAEKIDPMYCWSDIVLPDDAVAQLRELCQRVALKYRVLEDWGFDQKLSLSKGVNALFAGPSGTGKTMAAEVIANELRLDLFRVNLAGVVSKYVGETEKNLDRIFNVAADSNAILFFDEADALFGKRSQVRDSHDRYANIEISYLLQKMEQYAGLTILATNLRGNLDEAFTRRLTFAVYFAFPDEVSRLRIWSSVWPADAPLGADADLEYLARVLPLSGGNIRNIALAAAFLAAEGGSSIGMSQLLQATRREYQKMGKQLTIEELQAGLGVA